MSDDIRTISALERLARAAEGMVQELSLLRKQVEKLDRTVTKLGEVPSDVTVVIPNQESGKEG